LQGMLHLWFGDQCCIGCFVGLILRKPKLLLEGVSNLCAELVILVSPD